MTGKRKLEMLLNGGIPPSPPHWEIDFQIEKELLGMDPANIPPAGLPSFRLDVYHRLVDEYDWAAIRGGYDPAEIERTKKSLGNKALVPAYEGDGVFWMPTGDTMMDFAIRLFEDRSGLHKEAREKCEKSKLFLASAADAGADFFLLTYDFGYNDAPFVSPADFEDLVVPYLTELVQKGHDLGKKVILHSDGCISQILRQIHSTGIDGYQSVDPQGHMDIREVREHFPDWILMGNVACNMLQDTNEEKIRKSVRYCMEHGGMGKPYVFSTSNCLFAGMPPESYRIMFDEYMALIRQSESSHAGDCFHCDRGTLAPH